jgi:RNA polymerase sigma factor (sigma-70 family)
MIHGPATQTSVTVSDAGRGDRMGTVGERDESWFTGVYLAGYPDVVRYGLRRLADPDAAGELAQDVFVVAWRRRADVPDHSLPWLYGVARRLLANEWRYRRSAPVPVAVEHLDALTPAAGAEADTVAAITDLRAALAGLTDSDQEILRLVGWEQLTVAESAVVLDCSRGTAAVRLHRARRRLAAALTASDAPVPQRPATVTVRGVGMFGERQTRALLGPADPARDVPVDQSPVTALDMITLAESSTGSTATDITVVDGEPTTVRPRRRPLAVAALLAVTALAVTALAAVALTATMGPWRAGAPADPSVATPIAYRINRDAPSAGSALRSLADRITATGYDGAGGRYAFHRCTTWGGTEWGASPTNSPTGPRMNHVLEIQTWGTGDVVRQRVTRLAPAFADEESRQYWRGPAPPPNRPPQW